MAEEIAVVGRVAHVVMKRRSSNEGVTSMCTCACACTLFYAHGRVVWVSWQAEQQSDDYDQQTPR